MNTPQGPFGLLGENEEMRMVLRFGSVSSGAVSLLQAEFGDQER